MAEFDPKKFAEFQVLSKSLSGSSGSKEGGSVKKEKKAEKAERKMEEKPAEPVNEVNEMELDETALALAAEPKSKDPLDALLKDNFNMDDFKLCYSNEDETKFIPYFWEKFDLENYSIWLGEYNYNYEVKKVFVSCNFIAEMYQRFDKMRKNPFASTCFFGSDNDSSISAICVWRGQDLAFELSQDWQDDYESFTMDKTRPV